MVEVIKKFKLPLAVLTIYGVLLLTTPGMAVNAFDNSSYYLIEMIQILPVIFMLTVAIDVLVPKEWIVKRLGKDSGVGGALLALLFGSLSAGPIYAAFPIAKMLHKKGAGLSNIVIILSAWAVVKVPMLANEAKFLGPKFMAVRWILTVLFIFAIGFVMDKMGVRIEYDIKTNEDIHVNEEYCIGCGLCSTKTPEVFRMDKGKAVVQDDASSVDKMTSKQKEQLIYIAAKCPTKAIEGVN